MPTLSLTDDQFKSLKDVLNYIFEHESEDFIREHLPEEMCEGRLPETTEEWNEIDRKVLSGELDPPHIYCSATRVWHALKETQ
jgi:hypothetical protein